MLATEHPRLQTSAGCWSLRWQLRRALEDQPAAFAACSGTLTQKSQADGSRKRALGELRFTDLASVLLLQIEGQRGRFLFRSALIAKLPEGLAKLLDGEELCYFALTALLEHPFAQTSYATLLLEEDSFGHIYPPAEHPEAQRQYLRDAFANDPRWIERITAASTKIPEVVYAHAPGAPIRWQDYQPPHTTAIRIPLDQRLPTVADGAGLRYLVAGFSVPEAGHVWIAAERGIINFALPTIEEGIYEDYEVLLWCAGRRSLATGREQHCTIALNGAVVSYGVALEAGSVIRVRIPINLLRASRVFMMEITPDHLEAVHDEAGNLIDARRLSVRLTGIGVMRRAIAGPPVFSVGNIYR